MVLQILAIFKIVFSLLFSAIAFLCTCTIIMSGQILPVVRLLLALCRHLSLWTILSYSADFLGCLLDKIVKQKQVWVFSLKAEDPGNSCESCQLHKTLINSICLQALFLVFYSSDEWQIWGLCLSMSTLRQKNLIQFKREVDLLVRSLPLQTLGLELNISKRTNPPKQGWSGGPLMLSIAKGSSAEIVMLCHITVLIIFLFQIIFSLESYHSDIFRKITNTFFIF